MGEFLWVSALYFLLFVAPVIWWYVFIESPRPKDRK